MPAHPQPTRIVAVRHGVTAWNVDTRIQGQLDISLNAKGRWQAERVAQALSQDGLSHLYTSDLARARETAQTIGASTGLPLQFEPGLRERGFGAFEGHTWSEIERRWPLESARWRVRDLAFAPPGGGETLEIFYARVVAAVSQIAARHAGEAIALVAHGGVMDCLYRAAARTGLAAPRTWLLGNAALNRLLHTGEGFTLVGWSDTSHLDGDGDADFEFGDDAASAGAGADRVGHTA